MKRFLKSATLAVLGFSVFSMSMLTTLKSTTSSISQTSNAHTSEVVANNEFLAKYQTSANITQDRAALQSSLASSSTLSVIPNFNTTQKPFDLSFSIGGEPAQASRSKVVFKVFRYGRSWIKVGMKVGAAGVTTQEAWNLLTGLWDKGVNDDKFVFPNNQKIEWNQASDICRDNGGYLQWVNGVKTCRE
jgi:hypothetical protein